MIYAEKVMYARKKLGMTREQFSDMLQMSERSLANVENCTDESVKLSFDRMKYILERTKLPKGWFFYNNHEIMMYLAGDGTEVYTRGGTASEMETNDVAGIAKSLHRLP